jgi:hypothetical protein
LLKPLKTNTKITYGGLAFTSGVDTVFAFFVAAFLFCTPALVGVVFTVAANRGDRLGLVLIIPT